MIALEATGVTIPEAAFTSRLPGSIVEGQTNGRILADGQTVSWDWGRYDYVPHCHVTRVMKTGNIILAIGVIVIIIGGGFFVLTTGLILLGRRKHANFNK